MAVLCVMVVRDRTAGMYQIPFFVPQKGVAARAFSDQINDPKENNQFYKHPDDFDLYYIGLYDDVSGRWVIEDQPELVVQGSVCKITPQ